MNLPKANETLAARSPSSLAEENARFMSRVYRWMTGGILVSGATAWYLGSDPALTLSLIRTPFLFWVLIAAQLGAVLGLSIWIRRMRAATAAVIYIGYAALTGVTLSTIFLTYTRESISQVFLLTAFAFAGLSFIGATTKKDLGPVGAFCTMGLFGLIGFGILSFFWPSLMAGVHGQVYGIIGVIVFSGLTAYDTQKIKAMNVIGNEGTQEDTKEAIFGALQLYLDFINLFLSLLQATSRRR
jgi:FtsH-binding integral membrane protein